MKGAAPPRPAGAAAETTPSGEARPPAGAPIPAAPAGGNPPVRAVLLGERVRALRLARGMSQTALGGGRLTKGFISQVESGRSNCSPESLQFLAAQLAVPVTTLLPSLESGQHRAFLQRAAEAAIKGGQLGQARALVDELAALVVTPHEAAECHRLQGELLLAEADLDAAQDAATAALDVLGPDARSELAVRAHNLAGKVHLAAGRHAAALQYFARGAQLAEAGRVDPALLAVLRRNEGTVHMRLGDPVRALRAYERSRTAAAQAEDLRGLAIASMGLGEAARSQGEFAEAISHAERAVTLLDRLELRDLVVQLLHNIGHAQADRGDLAGARASQGRALDAARSIGDRRTEGYALERLAALELLDGHATEAEADAREAAAAAQDVGDRGLLALAQVARAEASEALGKPAEADRRLAQARRTARSASPLEQRQVLLREGALQRTRGDLGRAAILFEEAARMTGGGGSEARPQGAASSP
jgi:tetratricopeptide (TPR) repeat protein